MILVRYNIMLLPKGPTLHGHMQLLGSCAGTEADSRKPLIIEAGLDFAGRPTVHGPHRQQSGHGQQPCLAGGHCANRGTRPSRCWDKSSVASLWEWWPYTFQSHIMSARGDWIVESWSGGIAKDVWYTLQYISSFVENAGIKLGCG